MKRQARKLQSNSGDYYQGSLIEHIEAVPNRWDRMYQSIEQRISVIGGPTSIHEDTEDISKQLENLVPAPDAPKERRENLKDSPALVNEAIQVNTSSLLRGKKTSPSVEESKATKKRLASNKSFRSIETISEHHFESFYNRVK